MKNEEFDINRGDYEKKVETIRQRKRKLRNIQEPFLVKKIKKELKAEQRAAKRSDGNNLKEYIKEEIKMYQNNDDLIFELREMLFHHTNETAKPIIEDYLRKYPQLLDIHDADWYLKNC